MAGSKVVDLGGKPVEAPKVKVNDHLVSELEKILEHAKGGQIVSMAYSILYDEKLSSNGWMIRKAGDAMRHIAEHALLEARLIDVVRKYEGEEPEPEDAPA